MSGKVDTPHAVLSTINDVAATARAQQARPRQHRPDKAGQQQARRSRPNVQNHRACVGRKVCGERLPDRSVARAEGGGLHPEQQTLHVTSVWGVECQQTQRLKSCASALVCAQARLMCTVLRTASSNCGFLANVRNAACGIHSVPEYAPERMDIKYTAGEANYNS